MHEALALQAHRLPDFPPELPEVPDLPIVHLLECYGIRVSAIREAVTAALATEEDVSFSHSTCQRRCW